MNTPSSPKSPKLTYDKPDTSNLSESAEFRLRQHATLSVSLMDCIPPSSLTIKSKKTKRKRCYICRKKLGIIPMQCRCNHYFCSFHRYIDEHQCPYDYKTEEREKLRRDNPRVVPDKIIRF